MAYVDAFACGENQSFSNANQFNYFNAMTLRLVEQ